MGAWAASLIEAIVAARLWRFQATTLDRAAAATAWVGCGSTLVTFLPILTVPFCR